MTLSALIARVEEGTGPDERLDVEIENALGIARFRQFHWGADFDQQRVDVRPLTSSIDAIFSLIEQKLPGWSWSVHRDQAEEEGRQHWATVAEPWAHGRVIETAFLASPARALLCACLHALEDSKADLADATNGDRP